jgi:hypothetical protein
MSDGSHSQENSTRLRGRGDRSQWRLLGLLILFDLLLIAAMLLSFQETELIQEETTLRQTREVFDVQVRQQVITHTTLVTQIVPYGSAN